MTEIHDRMPLIITRGDYERWLSDEPDPHDLMRPYPVEPMRMWPISTRVNQAEERRPLDSRADRAICCVTALSAMELIRAIMDIAESTQMTRSGS